jgi:hypothetical protein
MPRATRQSKTTAFKELQAAASSVNENNDCAVKAVAIACNADYHIVRDMMERLGRQTGKGTPWEVIYAAIDQLGYKRVWVNEYDLIRQYPKGHRDVLKSVTTHHPDRFNAVWANGKTYLMSTGGHILAIVNGVNHDWTRGTARRCKGLWEVVPK